MDEVDRFAAEMLRYIEATFADQPELRDLNLQILEQEVARVRREDEALVAAKH